MGLFKQMKDIKKLVDTAQDVKNTVETNQGHTTSLSDLITGAQESLETGREMMAAQSQAATLAATGIPGTASVVAVRDTQMEVNLDRVVELDLTVTTPDRSPYPVTVRQPVSPLYMAQVQVGCALAVKVDAQNPSSVWIDFTHPV